VNCAGDNCEKAGSVVQKARIPPRLILILVVIILLRVLLLLLLVVMMAMPVVYALTDCRRRS